MSKKWVIVLIVSVLLLGLIVLISKQSILNRVLSFAFSKISGSNVSLDRSGEVTYKDINSQYSVNGSLPQGFPKDFPLPDSYQIKTSWKTSNAGSNGYSIIVETGLNMGDVLNFYKSSLPKNGWKVDNLTSLNSSSTITFEKNSLKGFAGLTSQDSKTVISITIGGS